MFTLPLLPDETMEPGDFYFYDKQAAVTRWKNATGTFNLCDISNTVSNSTINIAYEITVHKGDLDFVHSVSQETSIIISENINGNTNAAYDCGVFELKIPEGNNNFSFKCNNADKNCYYKLRKQSAVILNIKITALFLSTKAIPPPFISFYRI